MKETFKEFVASELRCLRALHNLKQKDVAIKAKIDVMTMVRYENNSTSMQLDILEKIVSVYGITLNIFFERINANMQNVKK